MEILIPRMVWPQISRRDFEDWGERFANSLPEICGQSLHNLQVADFQLFTNHLDFDWFCKDFLPKIPRFTKKEWLYKNSFPRYGFSTFRKPLEGFRGLDNDWLTLYGMRNLWRLVACGEKSFNSSQIKQISCDRFWKDLKDFRHEVTLFIRNLELAEVELWISFFA